MEKPPRFIMGPESGVERIGLDVREETGLDEEAESKVVAGELSLEEDPRGDCRRGGRDIFR